MPSDPFAPKEEQLKIWGNWYDPTLDCNERGWYWGWCPLHDTQRSELGSARFNWHLNSMRCEADPPCHQRRGGAGLSHIALELWSRFGEIVVGAIGA